MNIIIPRLTPWYSHDPVKSRSDIRHCLLTTMTTLANMFQTRYSNEQKNSYTTKNIFSVAVNVEYCQLHCLSIFWRNFGPFFTLLPADFHVMHSTLIVFCQKIRDRHPSVLSLITPTKVFIYPFLFFHLILVFSHFTYLFVRAPF